MISPTNINHFVSAEKCWDRNIFWLLRSETRPYYEMKQEYFDVSHFGSNKTASEIYSYHAPERKYRVEYFISSEFDEWCRKLGIDHYSCSLIRYKFHNSFGYLPEYTSDYSIFVQFDNDEEKSDFLLKFLT